MGLDSYGMVIVGQPEREVKWQNLREMTQRQMELLEDGYYGDVAWGWSLKHKELLGALELEHVQADNWETGIVGFVVAKSPCNGFRKEKGLTMDISMAASMYQTLFHQKANLYIASLLEGT